MRIHRTTNAFTIVLFFSMSTLMTAAPKIEWTYDEARLVTNTRRAFDSTAIQYDFAPRDEFGNKLFYPEKQPSLIDLAWCIVAFGEYSRGNAAVGELFKKIESKLRHLRIPPYVCFSDEHHANVREYCFSGSNGDPYPSPDYNALADLIEKAERKISARSGFKFSPRPPRAEL